MEAGKAFKPSGFWFAIGSVPFGIPSGRVQLYDWVFPLSKKQLEELTSNRIVKVELHGEDTKLILEPRKKGNVWTNAFLRCYNKILEADRQKQQ